MRVLPEPDTLEELHRLFLHRHYVSQTCWWLISFNALDGTLLGSVVVRSENPRDAIVKTRQLEINPGGIASFHCWVERLPQHVLAPLESFENQLISPEEWRRRWGHKCSFGVGDRVKPSFVPIHAQHVDQVLKVTGWRSRHFTEDDILCESPDGFQAWYQAATLKKVDL